MNFLVKRFREHYDRTVYSVMCQLADFKEEDIVRVVQRKDPLLEEFCFKKGEELVVLVEVSVEEVKPLVYSVVARFDRENMEECYDHRS